MRKSLGLLLGVACCLCLTACGPLRQGPLLAKVNFDAQPVAGSCSPTPAAYDTMVLGFDLSNRTRQPITIELIQPRDPQNLRLETSYLIGPHRAEIEYFDQQLPVQHVLTGWHALDATRIPAGKTYEFLVSASKYDTAKDAYLRDFVITYRYEGHEYQAATGFSYKVTHGNC